MTKRKPKPLPSEDVVEPAPFDAIDAAALKALQLGQANEAQQRLALDWIIRFAARTYDEPYRPEKAYDTAYACGRRSVGVNIVRVLNAPIANLEQGESP